ncbi:MAG: hypothetical protein HOP32_06205 [Nitrospira sp.]|nr:hypothetical protein [Nitrospira sp.]
MNNLPIIEYHKHPAFSGLQYVDDLGDEGTLRLTAEIDVAFFRIQSGGVLSLDLLHDVFERDIASGMRKLRDELTKSERVHGPMANYVTSAIDKAAGYLYAQLEFDMWKQTFTAVQPNAVTTKKLEHLQHDGFFRFQSDLHLAEKIWRATEYERASLRSRAQQRPWAHCVQSLHSSSQAVRLVRRKLESDGILALASAYLGCEMEWFYCALDFSHDQQRWYRDCYADVGLPTSKTVYMHLDADIQMVKAMLYLGDVSDEQGPFRYVRGSSCWARSPSILSIHKGFDTVETEVFEMEPDQLDYTLGYYRPRFKLPEHRQYLMNLPALLRGSTHFGDDVLDDSALSSLLLKDEVVFTGPAGTLVLFDGSKGIHRGSQVTRGERWAVQIALRAVRQQKNIFRTTLETMTQAARYRAHILKRRLKGPFG